MRRLWVIVAALLIPAGAFAQSEPEPRVIVVPYPGEAHYDAGYQVAPVPPPPPGNPGYAYPPQQQQNPSYQNYPPQQQNPNYPPPQQQQGYPPPPPNPGIAPPPANPNYAPPQPQNPNYPPPQPQNYPPGPPPPGTIVAQPPSDEQPPLPPENLIPPAPPPEKPSAMLDGHPREGAFLSGPGSMPFILHHTLLGLFAGVSTQLFPRAINDGATNDRATNQDARLAYLAAGLIGAGLGFASSATWQFFHWMGESTAYFGLANSFFGALFAGGFSNLITNDPGVVSWSVWVGALLGAWLTAVVGGGELAGNKGALMLSGAYWATLFAGLIVAVIASTSGGSGKIQTGVDTLMIAPGIGAGLMALALLKFNPSTAQILRADLFGTAAGGIVLIVSALVLGGKFTSPVPYALAGVAAAGGITIVSLLWAEAAESPPPITPEGEQPAKPRYDSVW